MMSARRITLAVVCLWVCLLPAVASAAPTLVVSPPSAPYGAELTLRGEGFTPGMAVMGHLARREEKAQPLITEAFTVPPDGRFLFIIVTAPLAINLTKLLPGDYVVYIVDGKGTELASVTFAVTPGLPNTGGGGADSDWHWLLSLLLVIPIGCILARYARKAELSREWHR